MRPPHLIALLGNIIRLTTILFCENLIVSLKPLRFLDNLAFKLKNAVI